jgi:hypothetical protein
MLVKMLGAKNGGFFAGAMGGLLLALLLVGAVSLLPQHSSPLQAMTTSTQDNAGVASAPEKTTTAASATLSGPAVSSVTTVAGGATTSTVTTTAVTTVGAGSTVTTTSSAMSTYTAVSTTTVGAGAGATVTATGSSTRASGGQAPSAASTVTVSSTVTASQTTVTATVTGAGAAVTTTATTTVAAGPTTTALQTTPAQANGSPPPYAIGGQSTATLSAGRSFNSGTQIRGPSSLLANLPGQTVGGLLATVSPLLVGLLVAALIYGTYLRRQDSE